MVKNLVFSRAVAHERKLSTRVLQLTSYLVVHFLIPYRVEVVPDHRFHRSGTDTTLHEFTGRTTRRSGGLCSFRSILPSWEGPGVGRVDIRRMCKTRITQTDRITWRKEPDEQCRI